MATPRETLAAQSHGTQRNKEKKFQHFELKTLCLSTIRTQPFFLPEYSQKTRLNIKSENKHHFTVNFRATEAKMRLILSLTLFSTPTGLYNILRRREIRRYLKERNFFQRRDKIFAR